MEGDSVKFHPYADVFPMMEHDDIDELAQDIAKNGLREPIWLYEGMILDGRNRWEACRRANVEPETRTYDGSDPVAFVVSLNLKRRHLTTSQRAMIAAKILKLRQGARTDLSPNGEKSGRASAVEMMDVGASTLDRARKVQDKGSPKLAEAVKQGKVTVSAAADIADLPEKEQEEAVQAGPAEVKKAAKKARARKFKMSAEEAILAAGSEVAEYETEARVIRKHLNYASIACRNPEKWTSESRALVMGDIGALKSKVGEALR